MKKVLVAYSANNVAAREFIIGVFKFINEGHDWNVHMLGSPYEITPETVRNALRDGTDGILTGFNMITSGYKELIKANIPLVLNNFPSQLPPPDAPNISVLHNDEIAIGRKAAAFFRSKGNFRSFAYVPDESKSWWSTFRQRGFRTELSKHGHNCSTFRDEKSRLGVWLKKLVKPAAILATNDVTGTRILEACRMMNIDVPGQIAVLGVDNDEIICNGIRPTLSSLHPNHVELARRSAHELDRIMRGKRRASFPILIPPIGIIERSSTQKIPPAGFLIREALSYISEHATEGITASDVARHLKVSHSLLRLRFRTILKRSVRDQILDVRFTAVNDLLKTTQYNLEHIAAKTGFSSANMLSHAYKTRFGHPPSKFKS
jgi:LacI family transcriptional regulator